MAHWFPARIETELRPGAPMRLTFGDDKLDLGGSYTDDEVLKYDPPTMYAFRWVADVLRFEIGPRGHELPAAVHVDPGRHEYQRRPDLRGVHGTRVGRLSRVAGSTVGSGRSSVAAAVGRLTGLTAGASGRPSCERLGSVMRASMTAATLRGRC